MPKSILPKPRGGAAGQAAGNRGSSPALGESGGVVTAPEEGGEGGPAKEPGSDSFRPESSLSESSSADSPPAGASGGDAAPGGAHSMFAQKQQQYHKDLMRETELMKLLHHPNVVRLSALDGSASDGSASGGFCSRRLSSNGSILTALFAPSAR